MIELIKKHREYRHLRVNWYIKWTVKFLKDKGSLQVYSFLPTITWIPWYQRHQGSTIFDCIWFNYHICIGEFRSKNGEFEPSTRQMERFRKEKKDG